MATVLTVVVSILRWQPLCNNCGSRKTPRFRQQPHERNAETVDDDGMNNSGKRVRMIDLLRGLSNEASIVGWASSAGKSCETVCADRIVSGSNNGNTAQNYRLWIHDDAVRNERILRAKMCAPQSDLCTNKWRRNGRAL